ncbi:MAG TPA: dipeptide ABC transporter ATP-binding protein [Sedimentisphaerales bacterium]|nr:dipeptide ABC transporter ATP-binding protein [Sedimentisphaerales bacterium]
MAEKNGNSLLLEVRDLKTWYPVKKGLLRRTVGHLRAVDGVSFDIPAGKTLGLVGESGCGKTTIARTIARLIPAAEGTVTFGGKDVLAARGENLMRLRREMSIIFQDPYGSLNPRMTVGDIAGEPMLVHGIAHHRDVPDRVADLLGRVGLSPDHLNRYPHEFSGGQRQRIGIARALALSPRLVICDEPVSALDVSIQSQILNLLRDMQDEFNLTYLFIAHDLAVVEFVSDVVAVMYLGRIVERAPAAELYERPLHPYTQALMSAVPEVAPEKRRTRKSLGGEIPSPANPPSGCTFHPRCPLADDRCAQESPELEPKETESMHFVACWKCPGR